MFFNKTQFRENLTTMVRSTLPRPAAGVACSRPAALVTRRVATLAFALPLLVPHQPAIALLGFGSPTPRVEELGRAEVCQARARDQDFIVIRFTGRFACVAWAWMPGRGSAARSAERGAELPPRACASRVARLD